MLVDVHAHLDHALFADDLGEVIARAKQVGVAAIISNGVNPESNARVVALSKKYDIVKASFGLYPMDILGVADESGMPRSGPIDVEKECAWFETHKDAFVSIGEVGLDYKLDAERHDAQKAHFQRIIDLAEKTRKPLIVHSRKAEQDVVEMLESSSVKRVVLHCFMGNKKLVRRAADAKFSFSVPAIVARLQHFQMLASEVALSQLLTETDCPWLTPFPGKRNEPAFVEEAVKKIAEVKTLDAGEVAKNIFMNFQNMFLRNA